MATRSHLERLSKDELVDLVVNLQGDVDDLRDELDELQAKFEDAKHTAGKHRAAIAADVSQLEDCLDDDLDTLESDLSADLSRATDTLHRERSKLARRVTALEDEVGIEPTTAVKIAEAGKEDAQSYSRLSLLLKHGPEAVSDRPTETQYRARELLRKLDEWGTKRSDAYTDGVEYRLASKKHDLKTRLEDVRGERLEWTQVYRAMRLIDEWSGANIVLEDGNSTEGKYVLVVREGTE